MFSVVVHVAFNCLNGLIFNVICQIIKHKATFLSIHTVRKGQFVIKRLRNAQATKPRSYILKQLLVHGNTRYLIHVRFIQMLRNLQQRLHETLNLTPKALVNAGRPRVVCTPMKCSYGMTTLDKLPRYRIRYWTRAGSWN